MFPIASASNKLISSVPSILRGLCNLSKLHLSTSSTILKKPTVASETTHTMGKSLREYLRMKVHPDIVDKDWSRILVRGKHERNPSFARVSSMEKIDKPFNWQRPTTSLLDDDTLQLQCFPGVDYVHHYASIVATYLSLKGRDHSQVEYTLPSQAECLEPLMQSNLAALGPVEIVIVGYVHGLERWTKERWEGEDTNDLFSWQTTLTKRGCRVAFLGCRICFRGDIGGNLIRALRTLNQAKCERSQSTSRDGESQHVARRDANVGESPEGLPPPRTEPCNHSWNSLLFSIRPGRKQRMASLSQGPVRLCRS